MNTEPQDLEDGWHGMHSAPHSGEEIIGKYGEDECLIVWSDNPVCILGAMNGSHPAGWATGEDGYTDSNLPMDDPEAWKPK
jgi:hypothetical protein